MALSRAPPDPSVAMLEVLGWSAEDEQSQPLVLSIGGHVVEAFAHRFEASQIVMLIEQLFEALQFGALHKPHLDLIYNNSACSSQLGSRRVFLMPTRIKNRDANVPQKNSSPSHQTTYPPLGIGPVHTVG